MTIKKAVLSLTMVFESLGRGVMEHWSAGVV
jgi:hypothetical protein